VGFRERLRRKVVKLEGEMDSLKTNLQVAKSNLRKYDRLRKKGQSLVVCHVDYNQQHGKTFDFVQAYTDDRQLIESLDQKGLRAIQGRTVGGFINDLFFKGVYAEVITVDENAPPECGIYIYGSEGTR